MAYRLWGNRHHPGGHAGHVGKQHPRLVLGVSCCRQIGIAIRAGSQLGSGNQVHADYCAVTIVRCDDTSRSERFQGMRLFVNAEGAGDADQGQARVWANQDAGAGG